MKENAELCVKRKESMAGDRSKFVCKRDDLEEDSENIFDDYYGETIEDNENSAKPFEVIEDEFSEDMSDDCVENLDNIEDNIKPSESDAVDELMIKDANKEDSLDINSNDNINIKDKMIKDKRIREGSMDIIVDNAMDDKENIMMTSDWIKKKYVEEDIFDDKKDLKYTFKEHIDKKKDCYIKEEYVEEDFKDIIDEHDVDD